MGLIILHQLDEYSLRFMWQIYLKTGWLPYAKLEPELLGQVGIFL